MKDYYARINGKDYPIATGFALNDEFSETLDSGAIRLPHVFSSDLLDLKPYDDIIIHDYGDGNLPGRAYGEVFTPTDGHFYRHMLVGSYTREQVFLPDSTDGRKCHNYTIDLVSETKGLETVQLPNRTISQPMGTGDAGTDSPAVVELTTEIGYGGYRIPYGTVNKIGDGYLAYYKDVGWGQYKYGWFVFVGENSSAMQNQYSKFTDFPSSVIKGRSYVLPDWNISGVTVCPAFKTISFLENWYPIPDGVHDGHYFGSAVSYHPVKHWIIRKLNYSGQQGGVWDSRENIITTIKLYLAGLGNFEDIVNEDWYGERDIVSSDQISVKRVTIPDDGTSNDDSYLIYIYCEPCVYNIPANADIGINAFTFNAVGMTSTAEPNLNEESEFLAVTDLEITSRPSDSDDEPIGKSVMSVYEAVREAVDLYSPYVKTTTDGETWEYRRKYILSDDVKTKFNDVIAPENQWSYPNLRDFITRLFYVSDCIPVVHDNVISYMSLADRNWNDFDPEKGKISYESYSMDGSSYCDRTLRNYSDALSRDNVVNCVERIGFKNDSAPTLTIDSLRLELSHPIYRIKKVYLCYYARYDIGDEQKMRLVKQDISKLVLLNAQRNLLSEDWATYETPPANINQLAKFKYATIGYSIGDRNLSGWGMKYSHPQYVFWTATKTVIENILDFVMARTPFGVNDGSLSDYGQINADEDFESNASEVRLALDDSMQETVIDVLSSVLYPDSGVSKYIGNYTQRIRSLSFIIEYEGYVSSAVISSKDFHDGNVVARDNQSSALSFVESDGVNQKEKVNRLGNGTLTVTGRYTDLDDIQPLSCVWQDEDHEDMVVYRRSIRFDIDSYTVTYTLSRDYTIRNYFTSVFSKHRPFALASYDESVERQENKSMQLLFSDVASYYQEESKQLSVADWFVDELFTFYVPSEFDSEGNVISSDSLTRSYYYVFPDATRQAAGQCGAFAVDLQKFTSGNSLCFSIPMKDNVSGGVYISDLNNNLGSYVGESFSRGAALMNRDLWDLSHNDVETTELLTGAKQDWFMFPVDPETGNLTHMGFGVGKADTENDVYGVRGYVDRSSYDIATASLLPLMDSVFERPNGKTIYFGQYVVRNSETYAVGAGFPRISFKLKSVDSESKYYADLSNANLKYSYSDWVLENPRSPFGTVDGLEIPEREKITEAISAKFMGRSNDYDQEETDDCVFKDGKERITTTLQIEPISDSRKIRFGEYMMKLSDVVGGLPKTYEEKEFERTSTIVPSTARINCARWVWYNNSWVAFHTTFTFPTISISIPSGDTVSYPIDVNEDFRWHQYEDQTQQSLDYVFSLKSIDGEIYENGERKLLVTASISYNGNVVAPEGTIKLCMENEDGFVYGRTGNSMFNASVTFPQTDAGFVSFHFAEDGFFIADDGTNAQYLAYNQLRGWPTWDEKVEKQSKLGTMYGEDTIEYSTNRIISSCETFVPNYTEKITDYQVTEKFDFPYGETITIPPTLVWCVFDSPMSDSTPYETISYSALASTPGVYIASSIGNADEATGDYKFLIDRDISVGRDSQGRYVMDLHLPSKVTGNWGTFIRWKPSGAFNETNGTLTPNASVVSDGKFHVNDHDGGSATGIQNAGDPISVDRNAKWVFLGAEGDLTAYDSLFDGTDGLETQLAVMWLNTGTANLGVDEIISATGMGAASPSWYCDKTTADDYYQLYGNMPTDFGYVPRTNVPYPINGRGSLRCYYVENGMCRFVFGVNVGTAESEGIYNDCVYPLKDGSENPTYRIFVSLLDTRSKTVISDIPGTSGRGDPLYEIENFADSEESVSNKCVEK